MKRRANRKLFHGDQQGENIEPPPPKKLQPKVIRKNNRKYKKWEFGISSLQGDKAKKQGCTIAHLLSNQELENLRQKGTVILHVTKPYYPILKSGKFAKEIYWSIIGSISPQVFKEPFQQSVVIVTTYDQVQHDRRFCFVGSCERSNRKPETWVMLCLVVQSKTIREDQLEYNVVDSKYKCKKCKNNIVAKNTGHYKSRGGIFGFGSRREFKINPDTHLSVGQYKTHEHFKHFAATIQGQLLSSMKYVRNALKDFIGYDLLKDNSISLSVSETLARKQGISQDFHLQGETCYTSLFMNVDASTMDRHIELDWSMTTIYVPQQKWEGKESDHLRFLFHLTGQKSGLLQISMSPGTIIYFHGSLLTHQQIHKNGDVSENGCCVNLSGYANRALLCNYVTMIQRIKQEKRKQL